MQDDTSVERKVQLTGGSTYTVSLPKEWASEQGIEPGAMVSLHSQGDQLVMTRRMTGPESETHRVTIEAADRDPTMLKLTIGAAYVAGCDDLRIEGLRTSDQRRTVVATIRGFIGIEVMEETESELVAKTMLDMADLSPEQTLAQLERTVLTMHEDAVAAVVEADGEEGRQVARQDDDVDRLFALISRGFQQSLVDPALSMGNGGLTPFEYYMTARQLERVGDHAEKIARLTTRFDGPPAADVGEQLVEFGHRSREVLRQATAGLEGTTASLEEVIVTAEALVSEIEAYDQQLYAEGLDNGYLFGVVLDSLVRTGQYGVNIAEAGLQARHRL